MSSDEIQLHIAIWFAELLNNQVQAMSIYLTLKLINNPRTPLENLAMAFQQSLMKQIEANRAHIDENLLYTTPGYRDIQLKKSRIKRVARDKLSISNEGATS